MFHAGCNGDTAQVTINHLMEGKKMREEISRLAAMAPKPTRSNVTDNIITKEDATMNNTTSTATTNNTTAKENTMNREITTSKRTESQFAVSYQQNGYGGLIPTIDGIEHPELMMGYVSEADAEAGLKLLEEALKATNGNIPQAMRYMYNACKTSAKEIKADEAVTIDGVDVVIDYAARKAYKDGEEVANLDSVPSTCPLPTEAIKSLLIEKVKEMIDHYEYDLDEDEDWEF